MVTDSHGLLFDGRSAPMDDRKRRMAATKETVKEFGLKGKEIAHDAVVESVAPSVLIGVCGKPSTFTEPMIKAMATAHATPFVMPLSNPTSKAEAVPADILSWSDGRALIATGSPFPDVTYEGEVHRIGQANNVFIFPGMGLGCVVSNAKQVTPGMFNAAARALAKGGGERDAQDAFALPADQPGEGHLPPGRPRRRRASGRRGGRRGHRRHRERDRPDDVEAGLPAVPPGLTGAADPGTPEPCGEPPHRPGRLGSSHRRVPGGPSP